MTIHPALLTSGNTLPLAHGLDAHGDRTALLTPDGEMTYRELAARVADTARRLGPERRLVLLPGANTPEALIVHLAALSAGHPVLLVPGDHPEAARSLTEAYDPDVVVRPAAPGEPWVLDERRTGTAHDLHPDLALLLSTSGSTGSPKLVRLSYDNLQANAESIAAYLGIRETDRAATTLPMHYCYGLSVLHSHLLRGAGLILTGLSVADACFWELFRSARGTALAGVPYTFDLLDRVGFDAMDLPHLRYVTQAGGRLAPETVTRYAELGERRGWDLFVMYGQTEATARMAYLPPDLAAAHPASIGVPVPGGAFRLDPVDDERRDDGPGPDAGRLHPVDDGPGPDAGELVYTGPNVMLGYARTPADLARGRDIRELRTGDLARRTPEGLYEIVGRRSRFVKILGLRIDPQRIETALARQGVTALCTGDDTSLVIAAVDTPDADADRIRGLAIRECRLPPRAVDVRLLADLPRLPSGKPDYEAIRALPRESEDARPLPDDLCPLYARILDRTDVTPDSSFVSLGGDSLSYVEMSLQLEKRLGSLPPDWHTRPIRDLAPPENATPQAPSVPRPRRRTLETSVALRALAIFFIVGSHIHVFGVKGGAHLLLAVAGYNFARFHLTDAPRRERIRHAWTSIARVAVPSMVWIAGMLLLADDYTLSNLALLHSVLGPHDNPTGMHFWFIEALVYILVAVVALLALRWADRAERRFPYGLPLAVAAAGLLTRYDLLGLPDRSLMPDAVTVFWLFALGWAAAKATTVRQRLLVTAATLATVPGFFPEEPMREALIVAGFALLVWVPVLPSHERLNRLAGALATASLYIYLTHWQIYPLIDGFSRHLAFLASLVFGVAYAAVANRAMRALPKLQPRRRLRRGGPGAEPPAWTRGLTP
ncbi:AMP-binding protein [Streptomyces sp. MUM 178J]|uniref:AMP-binding protein n=1 Tax=Streptomyces sp. MUM 178J TaxID=2791991 RepID=UPI001F0431AE|nr:AMP-binding protein [Streptomyces sp. MUM 178J]WRQ80411.1 AMP-binding protein [Streptomyces sp. MUM 178J]